MGVEHGARGLRVHVLAAQEDVAQHLLVGDVGEDAQLDLAVVGGEQAGAALGDEAGADRAADLGADRDVLQVRVGAGERWPRSSARRWCAGGRRHTSIYSEQRVAVGLGELGELSVALDLRDDLVLVIYRLQDARPWK